MLTALAGPWRLTTVAVLVAALLIHQVAKLWEQGLAGARHNYAPVSGIALPPAVTAAGQLAALPAALVVASRLDTSGGRLAAAALVAGWLLTVQRRLSNHAWLGALAVFGMALVPADLHRTVARDLLIGLYLSAALFKVNDEYLFSDRSAGRILTAAVLDRFGVRAPRVLLHASAVLVLLTELALGLSLLSPAWIRAGLSVAVVLHWFLGLSGKFGNFSFSIVAMALWASVLASGNGHIHLPGGHPILWLAVPAAGVLATIRGRKPADVRSPRFLPKEFLQGAAYAALCVIAAAATAGPVRPFPGTPAAGWLDLLVATGFLANLAMVAAGLKLDWSFAMFSSLRPFGNSWLHRPRMRDWPRYYALTLPHPLPDALLRTVTREFLADATRPGWLVHESVVHRLEATARACGTSLTPRVAVHDGSAPGLVTRDGPDQPSPRRTVLLFPVLLPRSFDQPYLG